MSLSVDVKGKFCFFNFTPNTVIIVQANINNIHTVDNAIIYMFVDGPFVSNL